MIAQTVIYNSTSGALYMMTPLETRWFNLALGIVLLCFSVYNLRRIRR